MNWVDLLVLLLAVAAGLSGSRQGMVTSLCSFLGVLVGTVLGLQITPLLLARVTDTTARVAFGVVIMVLLVVLGETVGMWGGRELRDRITSARFTGVDNALGAVVQAFAVFVVAWLVALPLTSATATPGLASSITKSEVLSTVDTVMPSGLRSLPDDLRRMLGVNGFPEALEPFTQTPVAAAAPPNGALESSPVVRKARSSVVKVRGRASSCSRALEGTGFVIAPHRVLTNAHVVAGTDRVEIEMGSGEFDARVVLFDPQTDLAVLTVPDLDADPLIFTNSDAHAGDDVIAVGYPLDGPYTASAGRVREQIHLRGPNIYDSATVVRDVYTVRAKVRSGNSGGPLIDPAGHVVGVVFGAAVDDPETGFALTGQQVVGDVAKAPTLTRSVPTGACTQ